MTQHGIYESGKLVLPPREVLGEEEATKTLSELELLPRVSFNVQLQSASGVVTQAPRAGSEFEAAFVAELTSMLESDGFTSWEAREWGSLVEGQLLRGEMRRVRSNVRALFGGLRLPNTIGAWAARVDLAPRLPEAAKSPDPAVRFRQELGGWTQSDREQMGFDLLPLPHSAEEPDLLPVPAPRILRLTMSKFAPASRLALDLASLGRESAFPQELVLECLFGADFPFEAPAVRVLYPLLTDVPLAARGADMHSMCEGSEHGMEGESAEVERASVGMAIQGKAVAVALAGAKCGLWSVNMGQSFPRFASWLRNWMMGSGARVDSELTSKLMGDGKSAPSENLLHPTVGGLWTVLRVVVKDGGAGGGWVVQLPAGLRVAGAEMDVAASHETSQKGDVGMAEAKEGDAPEDCAFDEDENEDEEKDAGVDEMMRRGLWKVESFQFVELSTQGPWADGGGRLAVGAVTSWDAAAGTVVISQHVAAALGIGDEMREADLTVMVRGVRVRPATRVEISAPGASANTLRYNLPDVAARLAAVKATCCAGRSVTVALEGGREIQVLIRRVEPFDYTYVASDSAVALSNQI